MLLTADDLHRRGHYRNAHRTLERLLALGVIPIVNENDTVATHEIRFGDNDRLAALVAHLVGADALVLLTDVDGLYTGRPGRPGARFIPEVTSMTELAGVDISRAGSHVGSGGMTTKIDAAAIATSEGIPVVLAASQPDRGGAASGDRHRFPPGRRTQRVAAVLAARTPPRRAAVSCWTRVRSRRWSSGASRLLPAGVTGVSGEFYSGEPVDLVDPDGVPVARGLVGYDATDLPPLLGHKTSELPAEFRRELVHRDDLVLLS